MRMNFDISGKRGQALRYALLAGLLATVLFGPLMSSAFGQDAPMGETPAETVANNAGVAPASSTSGATARDPKTYGLWVLMPAVVAIVLAIAMRQAVPALFIGVVIGAYMLVPCRAPELRLGGGELFEGIRLATEHYIIKTMADVEKLHVVFFTLIIGGAVGVMTVSGGTRAMVDSLSRFATTGRRGQLCAWFAGMIVFFDDYANSMIVGPTMRPMFDRLKISRAKLSYIVDSTAAPIASIALIGTWLGAELDYIQTGLDAAAADGMPAFLAESSNMDVFIATIPYRFYPILALWLVVVIALTRRDFGPMLRAESRALSTAHPDVDAAADGVEERAPVVSPWLAAIPILVLVTVTVGVLVLTGWSRLGDLEPTLQNVVKNTDSYISILYGALSCLVVASVLSVLARACSVRVGFDGALDGMGKMFPAIVILTLAWGLSRVSQDLQLGQVLKERILESGFAPFGLPMAVWLPISIFLCAAGVSFATGTSWATMGILTAPVVEIAAKLAVNLPAGEAEALFYASVGAVLAGAIFGDHCSPISDTTVLSAVASNCRVEEHVWTQLPYALLAAIAAVGGAFLCMQQQRPAWQGLAAGAAELVVFMLLFGRRPKVMPSPVPVDSERVERRISGS